MGVLLLNASSYRPLFDLISTVVCVVDYFIPFIWPSEYRQQSRMSVQCTQRGRERITFENTFIWEYISSNRHVAVYIRQCHDSGIRIYHWNLPFVWAWERKRASQPLRCSLHKGSIVKLRAKLLLWALGLRPLLFTTDIFFFFFYIFPFLSATGKHLMSARNPWSVSSPLSLFDSSSRTHTLSQGMSKRLSIKSTVIGWRCSLPRDHLQS